jgi:hypothetical protein
MPNPVQSASVQWNVSAAPALEELAGAPQRAINILRTPGTEWIRLAPGTSTWGWFPSTIPNASSIIGITDFNGKIVYITADRRAWVVEAPGLVTALSSTTDLTTYVEGDRRPTFARDKTRLFIAGGGKISYWAGTGNLAQLATTAGTSTPPPATHVVAIAQRIVAGYYDNSGLVSWTEGLEGYHLTGWDPLNFAEAESRPDKVVAVHENGNELCVFGSESTQAWVPDATVGFAPIAASNRGCAAAYSIIPMTDKRAYAWLSDTREIVVGTGRGNEQVISDPGMTKVLRELETVTDCFGYRQRVGANDLFTWTFPSLGATYTYDLATQAWGELRGFDGETWDVWPITAYHYWRDQGLHLVGLETGEVALLDMLAMTVAGQAIEGEVVTGFTNQGTMQKKQTVQLRMPMRRGGATGSTTPQLALYYRNDTGAWSSPTLCSMGLAGDNTPYAERRTTGRQYVTRQWKLRISGAPANTAIGPMEERFEVLGD